MGARFKKPDFESVCEYSADTEENQQLGKSISWESSKSQIHKRLMELYIWYSVVYSMTHFMNIVF